MHLTIGHFSLVLSKTKSLRAKRSLSLHCIDGAPLLAVRSLVSCNENGAPPEAAGDGNNVSGLGCGMHGNMSSRYTQWENGRKFQTAIG